VVSTEEFPPRPRIRTPVPTGPPEEEIAAVRDISFPTGMRGYDREAVDAYVRRVNRIIAELEVSRSPQSAIRHALEQVSEETRGILERAHETADEIIARSRAQAAERIEQAEAEAREIVRGAETRARMLDQDADEIWSERKRLIDDVQRVSDALAELADAAAHRFPPETPESAADTVAIEEDEAVPPPPPPATAGDELPDDGRP
jgi:cell division initiation protein